MAVDQAFQRTLVIFKPDAVQRQLVGQITARFEAKGLKLVGLRLCRLGRQVLETHYATHKGKVFYEPLVRFMSSGPVVLLVLEGKDAVAVVRAMMGPTFGPDAPSGTIRGDFGMSKRFNLLHGSDSAEAAAKEIALFFRPDELVDYDLAAVNWIYDTSGGQVV
jgi:nucleoside-diphosphate kinase